MFFNKCYVTLKRHRNDDACFWVPNFWWQQRQQIIYNQWNIFYDQHNMFGCQTVLKPFYLLLTSTEVPDETLFGNVT